MTSSNHSRFLSFFVTFASFRLRTHNHRNIGPSHSVPIELVPEPGDASADQAAEHGTMLPQHHVAMQRRGILLFLVLSALTML